MSNLRNKRCSPCEGGVTPLSKENIHNFLKKLTQWKLINEDKWIERYYPFADFYETISFVNAIAWIANQENHHPDLELGYNYCKVRFQTHAINGLSENDFICAAKIEALFG